MRKTIWRRRSCTVRAQYTAGERAGSSTPLCNTIPGMGMDLLAGALEQAERSEPAVRVAALLRIARLQPSAEARDTLEKGLEAARQIGGRNGAFLLEQARLAAAAVAPERVREI